MLSWTRGHRSPIPVGRLLISSRVRRILTQAYAEGPNQPPLMRQTVGEHFASIVKEHGDRPAIISRHQRKTLTFDQLDRESNALAKGLQRLGLTKGNRCAVSLGNNAEFATITYALFKLGAILVPLNPAFNSIQVKAALNHLDASHLVIGAETNLPYKQPRSNIDLLQELAPGRVRDTIESEVVPSLQQMILVNNSHGRIEDADIKNSTIFSHLLQETNSTPPDPRSRLYPHDIVNIQFTSGTTSMPKAACLTHTSILNNGKSIGDRMLLTPEDIVVCPTPLFHCFGCILGYMATATHGASIVFPSEAFDPRAALMAVKELQATALYGVPTMFISELELLNKGVIGRKGLKRLRTGIVAGSSIPAELMRRLHRELNLTELTICYGMTETSPVSAMTTTDDPIDKRVDSVGRLLPHVKAKVVDPADRSRILAVGERGELAVNGYLVMKRYWGDQARTDEVLVTDDNGEQWMHTGDEAIIDEQGYIKVTGRIKDLIIRGGENIHPLEVENCLLAHPAVKDVSVVGLPDQKYGEAVAAFVMLREGRQALGEDGSETQADDLRSWVKQKLSHHLSPKHVFWVDGYPKTASGKIQKFKLKERGIDLLEKANL